MSKAPVWRLHANEYPARLAGRAIAIREGGQGFAYIRSEGHPVVKQSLASNEDFAGSPVGVLELETDDFPGAKARRASRRRMA